MSITLYWLSKFTYNKISVSLCMLYACSQDLKRFSHHLQSIHVTLTSTLAFTTAQCGVHPNYACSLSSLPLSLTHTRMHAHAHTHTYTYTDIKHTNNIPLKWIKASFTTNPPEDVEADNLFWACLLVVKTYMANGFSLKHHTESITTMYIYTLYTWECTDNISRQC